MTSEYLSKDRAHLAELQRKRRARLVRIDYMPSKTAQAIIQAKRDGYKAGTVQSTNSAVLDAIVIEWAALTGIKCREVETPKTSASPPELSDTNARAYGFGKQASSSRGHCGAKRHRDGQPCRARAETGKQRCRFHGGRSTGPKTEAGKARSLANLRRGTAKDLCDPD